MVSCKISLVISQSEKMHDTLRGYVVLVFAEHEVSYCDQQIQAMNKYHIIRERLQSIAYVVRFVVDYKKDKKDKEEN